MKKILPIILLLTTGLIFGLALYYFISPPFTKLSAEEMYEKIITQRDFAIERVVNSGIYNCCVEPACTMCYMEANQWNNQKAGRCDCADLIGQGQEPCPQCERLLAQSENNTCALDEECSQNNN